MLTETMQKALNRQLNRELYSAYLYLSMAAYCDSKDMKGFASWMKVQTQEEMTHAMKFYKYLEQSKARIFMDTIEAPQVEWESVLSVFENVYSHEQKVTGLINNLVELAKKENDATTGEILKWFVKEQIEEEESAENAVKKIKETSLEKSKLDLLGQEMGKRKFKYPSSI